MADDSDNRQITLLIEAVQKLTVTGEQVAASLAKLEALYIDMLRKKDEDRAEGKERQKKFDEEHEEFRNRQKRWDERNKKWDEQDRWRKNPWSQPRELGYLFLMVAFAALAIAVSVMAAR
jgi:hypothetical protein